VRNKNPIAKSFRELKVYQVAREGARRIYELTKRFPAEERYALTDQIRRASRAVKAMIGEGWARRRYKAVFVSKLDEALGEAVEAQSWLDDAADGKYLSVDEFTELDSLYNSITRVLSCMIDRADDFCKYSPATDYRSIQPRIEEASAFDEALPELDEFLGRSP
jgi:four helix bundle protein